MDHLTGITWVRFVRECIDDIMRGVRRYGRSATVIVIRNRWSFIGERPINQRRRILCMSNDNARS